jgi:itaconyl-CoA hydratase
MFSAFRRVGPNRIRENVGLAFEDFAPDQIFHHRPGITVTQQDNVDEALATYNQAMIHYDHHYADNTEFRLPLVVSTLTLQRAIGMAWKTFGRRKRILAFRSIALTAPVFGGDTLYARSRILETKESDDRDCGKVAIETHLAKQDKSDVAKIAWDALVYRRDRGPFAALGL